MTRDDFSLWLTIIGAIAGLIGWVAAAIIVAHFVIKYW